MEVIVPLAWSVLPALVVLSVGGGWLISSSSFKPMEKVIAAAESISGGEDLSRRIGLPRGWNAPLRRRRSLPRTPAMSCGRR